MPFGGKSFWEKFGADFKDSFLTDEQMNNQDPPWLSEVAAAHSVDLLCIYAKCKVLLLQTNLDCVMNHSRASNVGFAVESKGHAFNSILSVSVY